MRARPALSVIEVLVALMLITIALLGMAGSTALALRQITEAGGRRIALHSALTRFGMLAAEGCLRASSGVRTDSVSGLREHWIVVGSQGFAQITDTVEWRSVRGTRVMALESAFTC
jgi:hypothetical protein